MKVRFLQICTLLLRFVRLLGKNHGKLKKKVKTFANELKALKKYQTAYMGKFHLNGKTKSG